MGIPLNTRHREVAPNQYECAPYFGIASNQIDENLMVMQLIEEIAAKHGLVGLLQFVTVLSLLHAALALVPSLPVQYATFTVFTLLRTSIYSTASIYVAQTFGFGRLGTVYGLMQTGGALSNLSIAPIAAWILNDAGLDGDWTPLLTLWIVMAVALYAMVEWLARCA